MSDVAAFIQDRVRDVLRSEYEAQTRLGAAENSPKRHCQEPVNGWAAVESIWVRVTSDAQMIQTVPAEFRTRYQRSHGYPAKIPYRSQCIMIFQRIDGVDVVVFAM